MDSVKLMNRVDRKFWFESSRLEELLEAIADDYYILEIDGERNMPYATTYYDTPSDEMYNNHHRGKMNRYKIRRRSYLSSQSSFLEIKFKNNKGRTHKVRQPSKFGCVEFNQKESDFIGKNSPYQSSSLREVLQTSFRRLMLVSRAMNERCTIDSSLLFATTEGSTQLDELVIIEVKSDGRTPSTIIDAMSSRRIKPSGFSKYCVGRSITQSDIKHNRFKRKHREIEKIINQI